MPTLTGSLPHTRAFFSAFWDGPADTPLAGLDIGATVHYTGQYQDNNIVLVGNGVKPRKIREWTTLDVIASYTFNLRVPATQQEVAGYGKNIKTPAGKEENVLPIPTAEYGARGCALPARGFSPHLSRRMADRQNGEREEFASGIAADALPRAEETVRSLKCAFIED